MPLSADPTKAVEWRSVGTGPNHAYLMRRLVVDPSLTAVSEPIPANTNTRRIVSSPGVEWDVETGNVTVERDGLLLIAGVIPPVMRIGAMSIEADKEWMGLAAWSTTNGQPVVDSGPANFYSWKNSLPKGFTWVGPGEYTGWGDNQPNTNMPPNLQATLKMRRETRILRPVEPKIVLA